MSYGKEKLITVHATAAGWRWRVQDHHNRRITAASSEAYQRRAAALANLTDTTGFDPKPPPARQRGPFVWLVRLADRRWRAA